LLKATFIPDKERSMSRLSFCAIVLAACTTSGPVKDDGVNTEPATPVQLDPTGSTGATGLVAFFPSLATGELSPNNTFAVPASVYLDASPSSMIGGDYYFHVVDPANVVSALSSDDVSCRRIHVSDTGMIDDVYTSTCAHAVNALAGGFTVALAPYAETATSDYLLELTPVASYTGTLPADAVTHAFNVAVCGNGIVETGEQCDGGSGCGSDCQLLCGNGVIDAGEQCDDGSANGTAGDACSSTCQCVPS
jgi:cysteine-rich repeat protein